MRYKVLRLDTAEELVFLYYYARWIQKGSVGSLLQKYDVVITDFGVCFCNPGETSKYTYKTIPKHLIEFVEVPDEI